MAVADQDVGDDDRRVRVHRHFLRRHRALPNTRVHSVLRVHGAHVHHHHELTGEIFNHNILFTTLFQRVNTIR